MTALVAAPILGNINEAEYTTTVLDLARQTGWTLRYHTFNSKRSTEGYPDWTIVHRDGYLLFVELKGTTTKVDSRQVEWVNGFRAAGVPALVSRPRHWPILASLLIDPLPCGPKYPPQPPEEYS